MTHSKAKIQGKFYALQNDEWVRTCRELTPAQKSVLYYIRTLDPSGENPLPEVTKIAKELRLDRATVNRALKLLGQRGYIDWQPATKDNIEQQLRDRLHAQLGGLVEVATPAGRIDLLTNSEITEVKAIKDWKAALGQILVYSGFYPKHQKRLHLFGTAKELEALADIEAAVLSFAVKVTGEEVKK